MRGDAVDAGAIWAVEQKALPLAATTMILVFAKNRLYAPARAARRRGAAALVGHAHHPVVLVVTIVAGGASTPTTSSTRPGSWSGRFVLALRASYDSVTALVLDAMHFERRALLVGAPALVAIDRGEPGALRAPPGRPYRVVGRAPAHRGASATRPPAAGRGGCGGARPGGDRRGDPDRLGRRRRAGARAARGLPPPRAARAAGADDGRAAVALGPGGPGAGAAALRAAPAGARRRGVPG